MHIVALGLAAYYLWSYMKGYVPSWLPEGYIHLITMPSLLYCMTLMSPLWLTIIAACGIVLILDQLLNLVKPKIPAPTQRRSNIPPPP